MDDLLSLNNISIIYNDDVQGAFDVAVYTKSIFEKNGLCPVIVKSFEPNKDTTFAISIGGDGTLLKAARFYAPLNVPVFGINMGRLGFLAQANIDEIECAVEMLLKGQYKIQKRMMIESLNGGGMLALNDIVIKGDSFSRTSKLFLSVNGSVVCDYLADGIIVSTPTGSTAYTLSAGGPVVSPDLEALVIVPICPHTLTSRPLVIPAEEKITITSCNSCSMLKMSADGQQTVDVAADKKIQIQKSGIMAKLVILEKENNGFYSILREKLQWGVAPER